MNKKDKEISFGKTRKVLAAEAIRLQAQSKAHKGKISGKPMKSASLHLKVCKLESNAGPERH